jgi:hypothetical protein
MHPNNENCRMYVSHRQQQLSQIRLIQIRIYP